MSFMIRSPEILHYVREMIRRLDLNQMHGLAHHGLNHHGQPVGVANPQTIPLRRNLCDLTDRNPEHALAIGAWLGTMKSRSVA
jgi:hypothetical protein